METLGTLLLIAVIGFAAMVWRSIRRPHNFPPGPPGLFSFTKLNYPGKLIVQVMVDLADEYGSAVGLRLFQRRYVIVSKYESAREVMLNNDLMGRPDSFLFGLRTKNLRKGIIMTEGQLWSEHRRFVLRHLRDFGFGKSSMEQLIKNEVYDLVAAMEADLSSSTSGNIKLDNTFTVAVINILWAMMAGTRIQRGDPKMDRILAAVTGFMHVIDPTSIVEQAPFTRFIFPERSGYNRIVRYIDAFRKFIEGVIDEHRDSYLPGEPRDLVDAYLNKHQLESSKTETFYDEEQMIGVLLDLFTAGLDTTSNFLGFAMLYMIHHPDVQKRVQQEIDDVLRGEVPSLADINRLPYTEATLLEIQRLGVVAPFPPPHIALQDTKIAGYDVPKGTFVFVNLWGVLREEKLWSEPLRFRPERHLDENGRVVKSEHLIHFGLGKRICLGEGLARSSSFLFFASMMQRFRFSMPIGSVEADLVPSLEPIAGLTLSPKTCVANVAVRHLDSISSSC